jgi:hypothetical protein
VYARSTTILADPSAIDTGIAYVRDEVWPAINAIKGCQGLSLLVDRASGKSITTTAWATEAALRDSRAAVMALRDEGVVRTGSKAPTVEEWEIVSMHRAHETRPGSFVRAAWSKLEPAKADQAIDFYKTMLLPEIEREGGFQSASLMVDRANGRGVTSVAFDTLGALEASRDQADYLRGRSTQEVDVEFLDVGEFELVLAHLHVPELV